MAKSIKTYRRVRASGQRTASYPAAAFWPAGEYSGRSPTVAVPTLAHHKAERDAAMSDAWIAAWGALCDALTSAVGGGFNRINARKIQYFAASFFASACKKGGASKATCLRLRNVMKGSSL